MKSKIFSIGVFSFLALLPAAGAADILGNWIASYVPTPFDETKPQVEPLKRLGETIFSFKKVDGTKLTGTVSDPQGETTIREGTISGDRISFVVMPSVGGNERKARYSGQVFLNEIRFTLEVQGLEDQPLECIAKREFQRHGDLPLRSISVPAERPPKLQR
jgi:hypothetical protein